jgi:hypothetical protein
MTLQVNLYCKQCGYFHALLQWYQPHQFYFLPIYENACSHYCAITIYRYFLDLIYDLDVAFMVQADCLFRACIFF